MSDLTSKLGEINDIEHKKGSKIYPNKSSYFRLYYVKHTTSAQVFKYHSDMGHCFLKVVEVSKKVKKIILYFFNWVLFLIGKKLAIFDWEWGRNLVHRNRQKIRTGQVQTNQYLFLNNTSCLAIC